MLHWGFMEELSSKKAGSFSGAGANYLFSPRISLGKRDLTF